MSLFKHNGNELDTLVLIDMINFASITNVHIFLDRCVNKTKRFVIELVNEGARRACMVRGQRNKDEIRKNVNERKMTPFYN